MKMPWQNKTGLAKFATIFAALLLISLGLCGANFALFVRFGAISGGTPPPDRPMWATSALMIAGTIELGAMILSASALIIIGLIALKNVFRRTCTSEDQQ